MADRPGRPMTPGWKDLVAALDQDFEPPSGEPEIPRAAVAAVFRPAETGTRLLFIQRAAREGDPWSGQMAFPGGRAEPRDSSLEATAERETIEEVGLDLTSARRLGAFSRLDGGRANNRKIFVSAHAYWLDGPEPELFPNVEVADALWVDLSMLADRARYIDYFYPLAEMTFPGIQLDKQEQVVWGLTLRFLADLFQRLDTPFIIGPDD